MLVLTLGGMSRGNPQPLGCGIRVGTLPSPREVSPGVLTVLVSSLSSSHFPRHWQALPLSFKHCSLPCPLWSPDGFSSLLPLRAPPTQSFCYSPHSSGGTLLAPGVRGYPWFLSWWVQCSPKRPFSRRGRRERRLEPGTRRCCAAGFEGGRRSYEPSSVGGIDSPEKPGERILPRSLRRKALLLTP